MLTGALINNPWTIIPILGATYWTGALLLGRTDVPNFDWQDMSFSGIYQQVLPYAAPFRARRTRPQCVRSPVVLSGRLPVFQKTSLLAPQINDRAVAAFRPGELRCPLIMESADRPNAPYDGSALIADPIHKYVTFTVPYAHPDPHEHTEKDLIDSPWVQRLRYIYQLQSARWVYPSAEHTRFVHSLGTMHVAGRFARHLYPFLKKAVKDVPSANFVEELLRVTALVHDIGHGPFCHFFDDNFLHAHGLTHERLGQIIIREHLAPLSERSAEARPDPSRKGKN